MATDSSFLKRLEYPVIGIREQYLALKYRSTGNVSIIDNDKTVLWEGTLQPTALSRTYTVVIKYTLSHPPVCIIKAPDLSTLAKDKLIPHIYRNKTGIKGTQLCLYLPVIKQKNKVSEWEPTMLLADTVLPWASVWLLYFEFWLSSGVWSGGGIEHSENDICQR
ncbi:hypothetical protein SAMN02745753_04078 [Marinomonas polaris DSM 16579]|jgi:hypothetical protein|uniref:Type II CBASS E2 protein domain-containing protein n=1 Tax=Marinomonas polaris DSM 16579 TaxID=1122206 RepID=A0A1M5KJT4_9GAMM|nr:hypothetical protein [Marinomonas polaris]SHG52729.1 hypothetical protein SAMN02745753_04078 [Marinomonas polaris DSM 16579]